MSSSTFDSETQFSSRERRRLAQALAKQGIVLDEDGPFLSLQFGATSAAARVLLAPGDKLDKKSVDQLRRLAQVHHPAGGCVCRVAATPDVHPGDAGIAIGSVVETEGMLVPAAVGSDINCGMRLHVADVDVDAFADHQEELLALLKGDLLLGTRDVILPVASMRAMLQDGLLGWLDSMTPRRQQLHGRLAKAQLDQLWDDVERVDDLGTLSGDLRALPEGWLPDEGVFRDASLGTIGGGNHFVELQVVEEVFRRDWAHRWGVREGQLAVMVHSGSRHLGKAIGGRWRRKTRSAWPPDVKHPESGVFALSHEQTPDLVESYLRAEATAAHYGFANRLVLAELVRLRMRDVFGDDVEMPLVADLPHNITRREGRGYVTRKGACKATAGAPVLVPGSMGDSSFLVVGEGQDGIIHSASHGAGRKRSRAEMFRRHRRGEDLALGQVRCVTLKEDRRIEEAPAAYKAIDDVVDVQCTAGVVSKVARLRPLVTFKG